MIYRDLSSCCVVNRLWDPKMKAERPDKRQFRVPGGGVEVRPGEKGSDSRYSLKVDQ